MSEVSISFSERIARIESTFDQKFDFKIRREHQSNFL